VKKQNKKKPFFLGDDTKKWRFPLKFILYFLPSTIQPTTAQRCRSETVKNILEDLFSSVLSQFKKYHLSVNLKLNNLGIFQSLKLRNLREKILQISHKQNFKHLGLI